MRRAMEMLLSVLVLMVVWCKMMKIKMKIKMMILLLILDIVTNKDIAELQAGVDRSPQAQAWYKLAFEGLHGRDEKQSQQAKYISCLQLHENNGACSF